MSSPISYLSGLIPLYYHNASEWAKQMSPKKPPLPHLQTELFVFFLLPTFLFCLFFCFTAPNGSWEVPQIRRRKGIRLWCLKHSRRKLMKEAYLDSRKEAGEREREKRAWWMLLCEVMIVAFRLVVGLGGARGWGVGLADDKRKISFWKVPLSFLFLLKAFFPRWYRTHTHTQRIIISIREDDSKNAKSGDIICIFTPC